VDFILSETGLDPRSLELEITENVVIQATDDTTQRLRELKKRGIRISIDDFGTGYSSLEYLRRCDISALKIDPCFVRDMFRESGRHADSAIISAIIGLAHALKLQVIAEGVETTDQADLLRSLQCDEIQGYLISRPLSSSEFEALLRHQR
jgi:EAL domain-containing protein (putative c-di-GMP-specific phosphodiesterase class I)